MAEPLPTLDRLRQTLNGIDPGSASRFEGESLLPLAAPIDAVLGGGLVCGALHELAPTAPLQLVAATGFAVALAALAGGQRGQTLWISTDYAAAEAGGPYGPGLDRFGLASARLLVLRVSRAVDALWAMEEALRCRALASVIVELAGDGAVADLTATRRLALAARDGLGGPGRGLGLLLRHRPAASPSAAATRWQVAADLGRPDAFGGLGVTRFDLTLRKNRRGPSGRWSIAWDHHEHAFHAALPVGVAAPALNRSDRAPLARAG
jgi:protein ImuA